MPIESDQKQITIFAGPNGAGKTTFAEAMLRGPLKGVEFINADIIAAEISPGDPASVAVKAGRLMLRRIAENVEQGRSFALETTLSGKGYAKSIPNWREAGYEISLYFLSLPDPELSIRRVEARVRHGGHHIPEDVIRRRFESGLKNFTTVFKDIVDYWYLFDNSRVPSRLIRSGVNEF